MLAVAGLLSAAALLGPSRAGVRLPGARCGPIELLARKPFKGGNLDDFLDAADAESRYGPGRYAAVAEDAWKIEVDQTNAIEAQAKSAAFYAREKVQLLSDHAFLALLGSCAVWAYFPAAAAASYAFGALFGGGYLFLKTREADAFGASTPAEALGKGPPAIVAPVLLVLGCVRLKAYGIMLLPALGGFFTNQLASVLQIVYDFDEEPA